MPERAENGLLVDGDEVAPDEQPEEVAVLPEFGQVPVEEAGVGAEDEGPGLGDRRWEMGDGRFHIGDRRWTMITDQIVDGRRKMASQSGESREKRAERAVSSLDFRDSVERIRPDTSLPVWIDFSRN